MAEQIQVIESTFSATEQESFNRMITTPLGSRVALPYFGSNLYLLVDKTLDSEWKMLFNRYLLEAFFDENHVAWDERLKPTGVKITSVDDSGTVKAVLQFDNENIEISLGGF